jgi:hypothetical protein
MSDIKQFAVNPTARLHLRDASDELMYADPEKTKAIAVVLYGPGSRQYAKAQSQQNNRMLDKLKRKGKSDQTPEQKQEEQATFLAACTQGFENLAYDDLEGDSLAKAVYGDVSIGFISDQVGKFLGDWGNFSTASAKS